MERERDAEYTRVLHQTGIQRRARCWNGSQRNVAVCPMFRVRLHKAFHTAADKIDLRSTAGVVVWHTKRAPRRWNWRSASLKLQGRVLVFAFG